LQGGNRIIGQSCPAEFTGGRADQAVRATEFFYELYEPGASQVGSAKCD
jgi:hypothetical protein